MKKYGRLSDNVKKITEAAERIMAINDTNYRNIELDACAMDIRTLAKALDD